jgi:adenine phosphoribosyltransferase
MNLKNFIRIIPDFPKKGISYKDITPLLNNPEATEFALKKLVKGLPDNIDKVAGIESRGFLFGFLLAQYLGVGFVPIRKPGKLPAEKYAESYDLEYGSDTLEMHKDAIKPGERTVLHDDLLATGGTAKAACRLIEKGGGTIEQCNFIIELDQLKDRKKNRGL